MGAFSDLVDRAKNVIDDIGETADAIVKRMREALGGEPEPEPVPIPVRADHPARSDDRAVSFEEISFSLRD